MSHCVHESASKPTWERISETWCKHDNPLIVSFFSNWKCAENTHVTAEVLYRDGWTNELSVLFDDEAKDSRLYIGWILSLLECSSGSTTCHWHSWDHLWLRQMQSSFISRSRQFFINLYSCECFWIRIATAKWGSVNVQKGSLTVMQWTSWSQFEVVLLRCAPWLSDCYERNL